MIDLFECFCIYIFLPHIVSIYEDVVFALSCVILHKERLGGEGTPAYRAAPSFGQFEPKWSFTLVTGRPTTTENQSTLVAPSLIVIAPSLLVVTLT